MDLRRPFCFLGKHDWQVKDVTRTCRRCGRVEEHVGWTEKKGSAVFWRVWRKPSTAPPVPPKDTEQNGLGR